MMNYTLNIFVAFAVTCVVQAEPEVRKPDPGRDFFKVPGMYACSMDMKAALFIEPILTPEMREHINKSRWTKGQHKLPASLSGYSFDLNGDGVREHFVHTGECGADEDPNMLVLQIAGDRAEIIAAIQGTFGLIEREGDWADIVEFNFSGPAYRAKTGLRFDDGSYRRIWRIEQPDAESEPIKIEQE